MEIVTLQTESLGYSLCPTFYSIRLKSIQSPYKTVVKLQLQNFSIDISSWQDIRLDQPLVNFKVIVFTNPASTTFHTSKINPMFTKVVVSDQTSFTFQTVQINKIKPSPANKFYKVTLMPTEGYEAFLKYRKKVKKLENMTSLLDWKISCRIKITQSSNTPSYLQINQNNQEKSKNESSPSDKQMVVNFEKGLVKIQLQQLAWLHDPKDHMVTILSQNIIGIPESSIITFKFNQYLKLKFKFERLEITESVEKGLMSVRILESHGKEMIKVKIQNPETHYQILEPLVVEDKAYFDLEYYYLQKNLEDTMSNSSMESVSVSQFKVFQELRQLTPAFPNYPHIKNQILLPIDSESKITLCNESGECGLKVYELMNGLNSVLVGKDWIRFYVQFSSQNDSPASNKLRFFRIKITDIWNVPQANPLRLKIINNKNVHSLLLPKTQKELKNLIYQSQFSKSNQITVSQSSKITIINKSNKYIFTQIPQKQFYIKQSYHQEKLRLSFVSQNNILFAGSINLNNFSSQSGNDNQVIVCLENVAKQIGGSAYSFVKLTFEEIVTKTNSVKSLYKIGYHLSCQSNVIYQLKIVHLSNKDKQYKKKIGKNHQIQDTDFNLISDTEQCDMLITVRKGYFEDISNEYHYIQLLNTQISVNSRDNKIKGQMLDLKKNSYQILSLEFEDEERINCLELQITHIKQEFIDRENYTYSMRIPRSFWERIKESYKIVNSVTFQILSSKKQKKKENADRPKSKEVMYMDSSEFVLAQTDYRDSIALQLGNDLIGYSRLSDMITAKIEYPQKGIVFNDEGEWNLGAINVNQNMLLFIYTFKEYHDSSSDNESVRTVTINNNKKGKNKSIDLNKTIKLENNIELQKQINNLVQENRILVTKAVRLQSNNTVLHQKIIELDKMAKRQKMDLKFNQKSSPKKSINPNQSKNSSKYRSICSCGSTENLYIGYCQQCLKSLEKTYATVYKLFEEKSSQYESIYFQKVLKKQKIQKMQNKIKSLKAKLMSNESLNEQADQQMQMTQQMSYNKLVDYISSLKNQVFTRNLTTKNNIDSSAVLQETLQTKINQCNKNIFAMMKQIEEHKIKTLELNQKVKEWKQSK